MEKNYWGGFLRINFKLEEMDIIEQLKDFTTSQLRNELLRRQKVKFSVQSQTVIEVVCDYHNIDISEIYNQKKYQRLVKGRDVISYILYNQYNWTYQDISKLLKKANHTTILHAIRKVQGFIELDKNYREMVFIVTDKCKKKLLEEI